MHFKLEWAYADGFFKALLGKRPDDRINVGLIVGHVDHRQDDHPDLKLKYGFGFVLESVFLEVFNNCFDEFSVFLAFQRDWVAHCFLDDDLCFAGGYRIGALYGYYGRWGDQTWGLTDLSPVIPYAQIYVNLSYKRIGFEVSNLPLPNIITAIIGAFYFKF